MYTVKAATLPWSDVLNRVEVLKKELEVLIPQMLDGQRLMLHFAWFDAMMLVTRPALAFLQHAKLGVHSTVRDTNMAVQASAMARRCIDAAARVGEILPDEPYARIWLNGPWWCLAHYIIRALGVFKLAASIPDAERSQLSRKLLRWLEFLAPDDPIAADALRIKQHHSTTSGDLDTHMGVFGGESTFMENGWHADLAQPQFIQEFHSLDDLLDSDGVISTMVERSGPELLPMSPVWGERYG